MFLISSEAQVTYSTTVHVRGTLSEEHPLGTYYRALCDHVRWGDV